MGFIAWSNDEKTRKVSEAIRGCLSPSRFNKTGVRFEREPENVWGEWVAKNLTRKDRQVR
jgi:hypothetical protein